MHEHRLVGWWLGIALFIACVPARAQSTAAFPPDSSPPPSPPAHKQQKAVQKSPRPATSAPHAAPATPPPHAAAEAPPPSAPPPVANPVSALPAPATPSASDPRPPVLPYYDGMPVPPGYKVVTRPASGVITGGAAGLGASYGIALIFGAAHGFDNGGGWLAAPLVGPWLAIAERQYASCSATVVSQARRCVDRAVKEVQYITFVTVDGIFQLASGFLLLAGFLSSKEELIRADLLPKVSFVPPTPGRRDWALSVQGRF